MRNRVAFCFLGFLAFPSIAVAQTASSTPVATTTSATVAAAGTSSSNALPGSSTQPSSASVTSSGVSGAGSSSIGGGSGGASTTVPPASTSSTPPDVLLTVPQLSVGRIELEVDNLQAEINLAAQVANLVTLNAGVQVGISKVNITIADVDAQLELVVRLGQLVQIVNRTLASLDLNPALINLLQDVGTAADEIVGAVDGLLGSVVQGGTTLNFIIDNLGNIVQEVVGGASTIVGNYLQNMTFTGAAQDLGNGLTQKTYSYAPLNSLVNIVFNTLGQVVQAVVVGAGSSGSSTSSTSATSTSAAAATSSA